MTKNNVMTQAQGERVYRPLHGEAGEAKQPYYVITAIPADGRRAVYCDCDGIPVLVFHRVYRVLFTAINRKKILSNY